MNPHENISGVWMPTFDEPMVKETVACGVGCFLAVVTTLFPRPLLAFWKAQDAARIEAHLLCLSWQGFIEVFCSKNRSGFKQARLQREIYGVEQRLNKIEEQLVDASVEFGTAGRIFRVRQCIYHSVQVFRVGLGHLESAYENIAGKDYDDAHAELVDNVEPAMKQLIREAATLVLLIVNDIIDGDVTDPALIADTSCSLRITNNDLAERLRKARSDIGRDRFSMEDTDEHCFVLHVSAFGRDVADFGDKIVKHYTGTEPLTAPPGLCFGHGVFDFAVLFNVDNLKFALRNTITLSLAVIIAVYGEYLGAFKPWSPGIAMSAAMLLTKYMGSAMELNLKRLQGVTIGTLVGWIMFVLFGRCGATQNAILSVVLCVTMIVSMHVYYHSEVHSMTGLLLAYFGCVGFTQGCVPDRAEVAYDNFYYAIVECSAALFIGIVVDSMLKDKRASDLANASLRASWDGFTGAFEATLSPHKAVLAQKSTTITSAIFIAEALGQEAGREPRLWYRKWPDELYTCAVTRAFIIVTHLGNMERALSRGANNGSRRLMLLPSFLRLKEIVHGRLVNSKEFLRAFDLHTAVSHDLIEDSYSLTSSAETECDRRHAISCFINLFDKAVIDFIEEANAQFKNEQAIGCIEQDPASTVALILTAARGILSEITTLQNALVTADIWD